MEFITTNHMIEAVGWLAVLFKLATFSMNSMIWLRVLVILSSVCFVIYSALFQIWPLLAIEIILLSMNAYRLYELIALRRLVTHMTDDSEADFSAAMAYGKKREIQAGDVLFEKGDPVDSLYYIAEGLVEIEGQDVTVPAGNIFGEMAFFNSSAQRMATVHCVEDTVVYELNEKRFTRLQYEDPKFAMAVMRLVTKRLVANAAHTH
ncbi:Crp/Fnr family transcriptional regulator [Roseovarius indicus]|uniref:Cyclic nucleotide-binding protein n=1 Tax=Roseovarius indicus TaxID=540747 RepID=A0A0T5PBQ7_9RHOB|nr:cyclic nucleotide-binding domain-containing protein [Roseovarius indicus]KRS18608.1 cyclic nucleotide-binding protein [Roseovarius indicus]QEW25633.1 DNA-binding transcriptional dual regulator Crp [Roseovarius indicus]SFE01458.1 inner membrane protein [Roseovarius indicus]